MNLNKVFIIGRLTVDPQLRTTPSGQSVVTVSVATNRNWTGKDGKRQEDTQFHNIVVWGRQAEVVSQFLKKGSIVFVEGRLQTRSWQDNQGQTRRATEIVSERLQLGPRPAGGGFRDSGQQNDGGFKQKSPESQGVDEGSGATLPEISMDDEDIKPEDLPF